MSKIKNWDFRKWSAAAMALLLLLSIQWFIVWDKERLSLTGCFNIATGLVTIASLFLLALVYAMDQSEADTSTKVYFLLIWVLQLGVFFNHFVWMFEKSPELRLITLLFVMADLCISEILVYLLWFYQETLYPLENRRHTWLPPLLKILLFLNLLFIVIGTATGFLFYIDADAGYIVGPGYPLLFFSPIFTTAVSIYSNLLRSMPRRIRVALLIFNLYPIFFAFVTAFFPNYCVLYVALMMNMVFMHGTLQMEHSIERIAQAEEISEQRQKLTEKQTQMMISQIQPHFLYNALNAIYYLCGKDNRQARKMILMFSDYLRVNMDSLKSAEPIPFEKELTHTRTYLDIELLRFGNILQVEYDIQAVDFVLPALSLQPLVENAVKYGIRGREDGGTVTISTRREDGKIYITVSDDGIGFDPEQLPQDGRSHVGIENTRSRLQSICDGQLVIESHIGAGTKATIILEEKK
ncbi:MAG: histidine kinase [Lachnospiraceae bacterium]|nr:histidine kinase [Lachnospiraceae bacterium]